MSIIIFTPPSHSYRPLHFILYYPQHVDDRVLSGPLLANLSLLGHCSMRYNLENEKDKYVDVDLPPGCLQIVAGAHVSGLGRASAR